MSRRAVWAIVAGAIIVTGAWLWVRGQSGAAAIAPPDLPASLAAAEPDVAQLIRQAHHEARRHPRDANAWLLLGMTFEVNLLFDRALVCYRQAVALEPENARARYHLAAAAMDAGDMVTAEAELRRIIADDGRYPPAHWRLGQLLLDAWRLDEAEASFRRAIELDRRDPAAWAGLARVYLQRDRVAEATDTLEWLIAWVPVNQHYVNQLLGAAYRQAGRPEEAAAALARGRGVTMQWPDPWRDEMNQFRRDHQWQHQYAVSLLSGGRADQAAAMLTRLLERRPDDPSLRSNLAVAYRMLGQLDRSIALLEETVAAHPAAHEAQFNLALAYRMKAASAPAPDAAQLRRRAMQHIDAALSGNPAYAPALGLRGELLVDAGAVDDALPAYRDAAQADPASPIWLTRLGETLADAGRIDEADDALAQALRRAPAYLPALFRLAELRLDRGDAAAAAPLAGRLQAIQPGHPRTEALVARVRRAGVVVPDTAPNAALTGNRR